jgi:hypothetical protein
VAYIEFMMQNFLNFADDILGAADWHILIEFDMALEVDAFIIELPDVDMMYIMNLIYIRKPLADQFEIYSRGYSLH